MSRAATAALALVVGLVLGIPLGGRSTPPVSAPEAAAAGTAFSAVPDAIGAQDVSRLQHYVQRNMNAINLGVDRGSKPWRNVALQFRVRCAAYLAPFRLYRSGR